MKPSTLTRVKLKPEEQVPLLQAEIDDYMRAFRAAEERIEEVKRCLECIQHNVGDLEHLL